MALVRFLTKPVAIVAFMLAVFAGIYWQDVLLVLGIGLGAFAGVYKIRLFSILFTIAVSGKRPSLLGVLAQMGVQTMAFLVLIVTALIDTSLFYGTTAGILIIPLVICINGISEKCGLSHNKWGQQS